MYSENIDIDIEEGRLDIIRRTTRLPTVLCS